MGLFPLYDETAFNPEQPFPPTDVQMTDILRRVRTGHLRAALARGLEGECLSAFATVERQELLTTTKGHPATQNGKLVRSTLKRGDSTVVNDRTWTIQNNLLERICDERYIHMVTLVRPGTNGLPCAPSGFTVEPTYLREHEAVVIEDLVPDKHQRVQAMNLVIACANWGSWGAVPAAELPSTMLDQTDFEALLGLEDRDLLRIERLTRHHFIQALPAFAGIFSPTM